MSILRIAKWPLMVMAACGCLHTHETKMVGGVCGTRHSVPRTISSTCIPNIRNSLEMSKINSGICDTIRVSLEATYVSLNEFLPINGHCFEKPVSGIFVFHSLGVLCGSRTLRILPPSGLSVLFVRHTIENSGVELFVLFPLLTVYK